MKRFTVRDFIGYNSPCFSCGYAPSIKFYSLNLETHSPVLLRPYITNQYTEVDLSITYWEMINLRIFHTTNGFLTNKIDNLTKYLQDHKLFLCSLCEACGTYIETRYLDFNLEKRWIEAVGLVSENLVIKEKGTAYRLYTHFVDEKSLLTVRKNDNVPIYFDLPLLPKYQFKDRQELIDKATTYLIFM